MENLINVKCSNSTYLCNTRPNSNFYKDENLLIGAVNNNFQKYNLFKSLLKFYISDLNLDSAKSIYLYLFLDDLHPSKNSNSINISISGNDEDFNISTINWLTCPKKNNHTNINANIPTQFIKQYIKIDISHIIKSLNSYTNIYNIIIEPSNFYSSSMLQFSSNNGENPPYLVLENNSIDNKDSLYNYESNDTSDSDNTGMNKDDNTSNASNINANEDFDMDDFSAEIISELNSQSSRFDVLENNLANLINSFGTVITTIKSNSANLDNKIDNKVLPTLSKFDESFSNINSNTNLLKEYIEKLVEPKDSSVNSLSNLTSELNELIKTEIYQLKNSVNSDVLDLKSYMNNNISELTNSIKGINETLLQLSSQVSKLSETLGTVIIDPLDDKSI